MPVRRVWWLLQVASCLIAMSATMVQEERIFQRAPMDGLPPEDPVAIFDKVLSSLDCARKCHHHLRPACCSYGYSRKSEECRLYAESSDEIISMDSFEYFSGCPATTNNPPTLPDSVTEAAACPSGNYAFIKFDDRVLQPPTLNSFHRDEGMSESDCKRWCLEDDRCKSFDLGPNDCSLKYLTKDDAPKDFMYFSGFRHYQKQCV